MALGSTNYNGNGGGYDNSLSLNGKIRFNNRTEHLSLSTGYWKNCLKITLSDEVAEGNNIRYQERVTIFLSPMKAMILRDVLTKWMNSPKTNKSYVGVNTGMKDIKTTILFFNDEETHTRAVNICKMYLDGSIKENNVMHFNTEDYHNSVMYKDIQSKNYTKEYHNDLEIQALITILDEFVKAMTAAQAFVVGDTLRYDNNRISNQLSAIMTSMGINQRSTYANTNSSYNNNGNTNSNHRTLNDFEDFE